MPFEVQTLHAAVRRKQYWETDSKAMHSVISKESLNLNCFIIYFMWIPTSSNFSQTVIVLLERFNNGKLSRTQLQALTTAVNNASLCTPGSRNPWCFGSNTENDRHDQTSLIFSPHRLPINHNHKSAIQQHVSLRAIVAGFKL